MASADITAPAQSAMGGQAMAGPSAVPAWLRAPVAAM
jgi:hypothetical protein